MLHFKIIGGVVVALLLASLFSAPALANGRGVLRCDSCMTVNNFSVTAENYVQTHVIPPEPGLNRYSFVIFNPTDKLLGEVVVTRFYDYETRTLTTHVTALTGTVADMQQTYRVAFPDFGITYIRLASRIPLLALVSRESLDNICPSTSPIPIRCKA